MKGKGVRYLFLTRYCAGIIGKASVKTTIKLTAEEAAKVTAKAGVKTLARLADGEVALAAEELSAGVVRVEGKSSTYGAKHILEQHSPFRLTPAGKDVFKDSLTEKNMIEKVASIANKNVDLANKGRQIIEKDGYRVVVDYFDNSFQLITGFPQ